MNVEVALFEGFEALDAIGPAEVLRYGQAADTDLTVSLTTLEGARTVEASQGLRVEADGALGEGGPDIVVVPGGGWNTRSAAGAWAEAERGDLPERLADLHGQGAAIAGVCTGGMLLERAGLLDGRPAVTHQGALADLRKSDAEVVEARVVDDGDVLTTGGVTAGLDLALYLLEREFGEALADGVATDMEYERRGPIHGG
jgi:transcriptional regulator GlxA family with amidase domain